MILLLILKSGDVLPNPGPPPSESSDSWSSSLDLYNFLNLPNHLSTIHYNVQSIANKLDTFIAEFSFFDVVTFSETWSHDEISLHELLFPSFHPPERKDRAYNRYGGVILYMSRTICLTSEDRTLNSITLNAFGFRLNLVIKGTSCTVYSIDHQTLTQFTSLK